MSAMRVIDDVKSKGGKVVEFQSLCGGLPAPEFNDNPFGYKFSWAPRGVLLASGNTARQLIQGKERTVGDKMLFAPENVFSRTSQETSESSSGISTGIASSTSSRTSCRASRPWSG